MLKRDRMLAIDRQMDRRRRAVAIYSYFIIGTAAFVVGFVGYAGYHFVSKVW